MIRLALALLLIAIPAFAQSLPEGLVLAVFATTGEMRTAVNRLSLPSGDAFSPRTLRWRVEAFDVSPDPRAPLRMLAGTVDCRLYGPGETTCLKYDPESIAFMSLLAVRAPYEPLPPARVPRLGEWGGPLGYLSTGLDTKTPNRGQIVLDADLRPAFARFNGKAGPPDYYTMQLGLALVPEAAVQGARAAWARLNDLAVKGQPFGCRRSDNLCHVVVRMGAADATEAPLIGVCRAFRFTSSDGTSWLGPPVDCRVMASELDGQRRLLAITDIWTFWEGGDNYPSIANVRGLPDERRLKELLEATLVGMELTLSSTRGSRVVADTPRPKLNIAQNAYLRRSVATDFEGGPENGWSINIDVWVHEAVQNRLDRAILRHDLEAVEIDLFRDELMNQLKARCRKVTTDTTVDSGHGFVCAGFHGKS
jgi:hypothetical protein